MFLVFAALVAAGVFMQSQQCAWKAEAMGRPYKWGIYTGCMIADKTGQFVPLENYRVIE